MKLFRLENAVHWNKAAVRAAEAEVARLKMEYDWNSFNLDLVTFLESSDGEAALHLLKSTGRRIVFCEEEQDGGAIKVYFLGGEGLQHSIEAITWTAYSTRNPPNTSKLPIPDLIKALRGQKVEPKVVMPNIIKRLDQIADSV